jgi:hypothetical protein
MLFCFSVRSTISSKAEDRLACLREIQRFLRSGGLVWGAAISRFASLFDSLSSALFDDPVFAPMLARFGRRSASRQELRSAGFRAPELLAIEGPGWLARDFDRLWSNPKQRERLLDAVRKVESEQAVLRASSHIMAIARK